MSATPLNMPHAGGLNPNAMGIADASRLLTKLGTTPVTEAMLRKDLAAGAPANADGTLNLVHYAAWLAREVGDAE